MGGLLLGVEVIWAGARSSCWGLARGSGEGDGGGWGWSKERRRPGRAGRRQLGSYRGASRAQRGQGAVEGDPRLPHRGCACGEHRHGRRGGEGQARAGSVLGGVAAASPRSGCARVGAQGALAPPGPRGWAEGKARGSWAASAMCCLNGKKTEGCSAERARMSRCPRKGCFRCTSLCRACCVLKTAK